MAKTTVRGQISDMIREVERAAKQLRNEVRKQYKATPKVLDQAASQLRRGAAEVAYQVERYLHEVRRDLEAGGKRGLSGAKKSTKKRATKKRATKRATKKTGAKKSTKKRARKG